MTGFAQSTGGVTAMTTEDSYVVQNEYLMVRLALDGGAFQIATTDGHVFVKDGRFNQPQGQAALTSAETPFGEGKGVQYQYGEWGSDRILLFPGLPFAVLQGIPRNASKTQITIPEIMPGRFRVDPGGALGDLCVAGVDGLTTAGVKRTSYYYLAISNESERSGTVAGWLTHRRGSGVVLSEAGNQDLLLTARSEYGRLVIGPGEQAEGELFAIGYFKDVVEGLERLGEATARANGVENLPKPPSGYCTWYSDPHGGAADAESIAVLTDFAEKNLKPWGFEVVQIDDRWQIENRDYTTHNPEGPFPDGMKPTVGKIRGADMTPGLWLIPFGWNHNRPIFEEHQDWFVQKPDTGDPYQVFWAGTCLDMTHPEARDFLRDVVSRMTEEWGFGYLKIDGLWSGMAVKILYPEPNWRPDDLGAAVFHDSKKTNVEVYRSGLELVREAAGDDTYILGCNIAQNMRTLGGSFGLVDGMRVGRDIGAEWGHILPCAAMGGRLFFLHNRVWHNDPDCLLVREPLSLQQARAWGSWIGVTGQLNLVSEWLPDLPAERLDIVRRSMPNHGLCARPLDILVSSIPAVWHLRSEHGGVRRDVLAFFNWDGATTHTMSCPVGYLDYPSDLDGPLVGFDFWADRFVRFEEDPIPAELAPASCRVLALCPEADHPQILSTSRHVSQGILDVMEETWDAGEKRLSGRSAFVVPGEVYEMRVALPAGGGWRALEASASPVGGATAGDAPVEMRPDSGHLRVLVTPPGQMGDQAIELEWSVCFEASE